MEEQKKKKGETTKKEKSPFSFTVVSFFVPPILTVFYLIDLCDKRTRKRRACEGGLNTVLLQCFGRKNICNLTLRS